MSRDVDALAMALEMAARTAAALGVTKSAGGPAVWDGLVEAYLPLTNGVVSLSRSVRKQQKQLAAVAAGLERLAAAEREQAEAQRAWRDRTLADPPRPQWRDLDQAALAKARMVLDLAAAGEQQVNGSHGERRPSDGR